MSRISRLEVENFKKLTVIGMDIAGVTEISGPNGAGKSSVLDAISVLIDGMSAAPAEPIRNGQQKCRITGRIGEMDVIRHITRDPHGKHVTRIQFQPTGEKPYPATQAQLDDLIGAHSLDPMDFLRLDSKKMFKAFQDLVPGIDFAKSMRADAADFAERTEVNRDADKARAAADLIVVPAGTPLEPVDQQALVRQLQEAGAKNTDRETRRANRENAHAEVARLRADADPARTAQKVAEETARLEGDRDRRLAQIHEQIEALRRQDATAREECAEGIRSAMANGASYADGAKAQADELQARLDEAGELPEVIDTVALAAKIDDARVTNANVTRAKERAEHIANAQHLEEVALKLTGDMTARRQAREDAIAKSKIPIAGLEFGDGEIRLHGAPFEQASTAQRLRAAFAYCIFRNPVLRLVWIREGSLLDDGSFAQIEQLAAEHDCDVIVETVRPIGSNSVVLDDGRVSEIRRESAEQESAA